MKVQEQWLAPRTDSMEDICPRRGTAALFLCLTAFSQACGAGDAGYGGSDLPRIERVTSSARVPPSQSKHITLLDQDRACLIDSYRVRVLCGGRGWNHSVTVGSEGEGPGEYTNPADLARGPNDRSVVVVDYGTSRMTVFELEKGYVRATNVPTVFDPLARSETGVWTGTYSNPGSSERGVSVALISGSGDGMVASRTYRYGDEVSREPASSGASARALSPDGELVVFPGRKYRLARFSPDGRFLGVFTSPDYEPEMPSERDVEDYREGWSAIFGSEPPEGELQEFRNQPKLPYVRGDPLEFDSTGRLWVATTRDHEERSWFDLFQDGEFLGSVPVEDRVVGFDILGSTLAVLVEGTEKDSAGLYPRRIDWYRIQD